MGLRSLAERARRAVAESLQTDGDPEVERALVAGAVVAREGDHYRIELGGDDWTELEAGARRLEGRCDCGALLSVSGGRARCRTCGREFLV